MTLVKEQEKKKFSDVIWTELYRPKKLEHVILPERIKSMFVDGNVGDNYLFHGPAGTGKTTLAHILATGRSVLYIDASTNRGIDVVRSQIVDFASTNSMLSSKKKVCILDEMEKFTRDAQDSLKASMEQYHKNVIFICTSNHPERLIAPLHSRLTSVSFVFNDEEEKQQKKEYGQRIMAILKNQGGYTIEPEAILYLLNNVYPDMRKIIKLLYSAKMSLKDKTHITLDLLAKNNIDINEDLYKLLTTEYREEMIYKFVKSNYSGKETEVLMSLGEPFLEYLASNEQHKGKILTASMIGQKYMYEATTGSIDPLIPLLACCGALANILR